MPRSGWTKRPSTPSMAGACACCANTLSTAKACLSKPDWRTCRPCNAKPCKTIGGAGFTPWAPQTPNGCTAKSPHPPRPCWSDCCRFGGTWSAAPKTWRRPCPGPHRYRQTESRLRHLDHFQNQGLQIQDARPILEKFSFLSFFQPSPVLLEQGIINLFDVYASSRKILAQVIILFKQF